MRTHAREQVAFEFDRWSVTTDSEPPREHPHRAPATRRPVAATRAARGFGGFAAVAATTGVASIVALGAFGVLGAADVTVVDRSVAGAATGSPGGTASPEPELVALPPAVASPLPYPGSPLDPARYSTDLLGRRIEFTLADPTALRTARPGVVVLAPVGSSETHVGSARHVQFTVVAGWNTPAEAVDVRFREVGSIAPDDIEEWIAANDVVVDARSRRSVDGRPTRVYDLRVDPASDVGDGVCVEALRPCFWFASVPEALLQPAAVRLDYVLFGPTSVRFWVVEIDGGYPLLIEAAVPAGQEWWLDAFEATTIETLDLGR